MNEQTNTHEWWHWVQITLTRPDEDDQSEPIGHRRLAEFGHLVRDTAAHSRRENGVVEMSSAAITPTHVSEQEYTSGQDFVAPNSICFNHVRYLHKHLKCGVIATFVCFQVDF